MEALSKYLVRYRGATLVLSVVFTLLAAALAATLKIYDDPNRWPPKDDPAVLLNERLQLDFGGANLVTIMIVRKDGGDIVQADTLALVKRITDELSEVHGIIPYALRSLSTINSRYLKGTADELDASILFKDPNRAPETPDELARVRFGIANNAALNGGLVSRDGAAAIIQADFRTGLQNVREGLQLPVTDPIAIYQDVQRIITETNDGRHTVTAAGSPILIGWVNSDGLPYILFAFALVVAGIATVLGFAFRSIIGVVAPLCVGVMASVWAFGLQRMLEGDVLHSSAALLAPFIILAVAASHSVLFLKRFLTDEMSADHDVATGLERTLSHMFRPLAVVLCTDLMAFIVLACVPFDNVRVLGQITALGLLAIIVIVPTFLVAFLGLVPDAPMRRAIAHAQAGRLQATGWIYRSTALLVRPLI
ncbi:MAG: MMPL family transporter, partial [Gammaproteobacteria bacterium]